MSAPDACALVLASVDACPEAERSAFLRELLAFTAAGLVIAEGEREAAEVTYRVADKIVGRLNLTGPAVSPSLPERRGLRAWIAARWPL